LHLLQGGNAKLGDALLHCSIYILSEFVNLFMETIMQHHVDLATDMADMTRLEAEARRQRAAFMAEMLTAGWHAFTSLFAAHRTAS
jgi:hypothetical protein